MYRMPLFSARNEKVLGWLHFEVVMVVSPVFVAAELVVSLRRGTVSLG